MEKFNNTTVFTGYLKQLLHNYNLPKCKVYTKEFQDYYRVHHTESPKVFETITVIDRDTDTPIYPDTLYYIPYIKDGKLQEYIDGKWETVGIRNKEFAHEHYYYENKKLLNVTKNLKITNNIYDSYTHEYLGEYLRFQRDYNNLNLMPLYNCFSNRACDKLDLKWTVVNQDPATHAVISRTDIIFNTNDTKYKIYMVPIKLFQEYTIAIDSKEPIEMCCGMYGLYQNTNPLFKEIPIRTYQKERQAFFSQPFLYKKLLSIDNLGVDKNELAQNEDSLKLFIKVPYLNDSTIVILEGNYCNWNDSNASCGVAKFADGKPATLDNSVAINFENLPEDADITLKTPLQLLCFNTKKQHPFADRLVEYLTDNAITQTDSINKNIKRVQKVVEEATHQTYNGYDEAHGNTLIYTYKYTPAVPGFWDNSLKYIIYDYMTTNPKTNTFFISHDLLGYVDKDAEKYVSYYDDTSKRNISIADTTLEEGE